MKESPLFDAGQSISEMGILQQFQGLHSTTGKNALVAPNRSRQSSRGG
jgi:hypothetical protein